MDIFKGQKERTRQSVARGVVSFFGDFLGFKENQEIKIMTGNETVIFSDIVKKTNKRFKVQERVLLLTDKAVYNINKLPKPKKNINFELKRKIPLDNVTGVSVSKLADNVSIRHYSYSLRHLVLRDSRSLRI